MLSAKEVMLLNTEREAIVILQSARNMYIQTLQAKAGYVAPVMPTDDFASIPYDKPLELCRTKHLNIYVKSMALDGGQRIFRDELMRWLHQLEMPDTWSRCYKSAGNGFYSIVEGSSYNILPLVLRAYVARIDKEYEQYG